MGAARFDFFPSSGSGFAHGNRIHWLCGEVSANLAAARVVFSTSSGSRFAHGNRIHWLCGKASANLAAARVVFSTSSGSGFAHGNRIHWLCGKASANLAAARVVFSNSSGPGFAHGNRIHWLSGQGDANIGAGGPRNSADCTGQADKETLYYEYQGGLIEMTKNQKRDILDAIENTILFIIFLLLTPVMVCWELAKDTNKKGRYRRRR